MNWVNSTSCSPVNGIGEVVGFNSNNIGLGSWSLLTLHSIHLKLSEGRELVVTSGEGVSFLRVDSVDFSICFGELIESEVIFFLSSVTKTVHGDMLDKFGFENEHVVGALVDSSVRGSLANKVHIK